MSEWRELPIGTVISVTDFVANGSFESLRNNVRTLDVPDYAVLIRLVDYNAKWSGSKAYVDEHAYNFLAKSKLHPGDVIVSNVGANAGTVFQAPNLSKPMTLGPNAILCRPDSSALTRRYLFYFLVSHVGQNKVKSILSGSAQPKFNKTDFRSLTITCPPLHEQKAIAHILGTLDDKIDQLRKTNSVLEDMASALFKSWFVDFDPVKAKQENRPTGLPKDLDDLFPDSFEDSALGPIPKGWRVGCVGDVCNVVMGQSPASDYVNSDREGFPLLNGPTEFTKWSPIPVQWTTKLTKVAQPNSLLFCVRGSTTGKMNWADQSYVIGRGLASLSHSVSNSYTPIIREWVELRLDDLLSRATGSTFPNVSKRDIESISIPLAPLELEKHFFKVMERSYSQCQLSNHLIRTLTSLRDTLLPKLISGDLRVPDAEQMVAELGL